MREPGAEMATWEKGGGGSRQIHGEFSESICSLLAHALMSQFAPSERSFTGQLLGKGKEGKDEER